MSLAVTAAVSGAAEKFILPASGQGLTWTVSVRGWFHQPLLKEPIMTDNTSHSTAASAAPTTVDDMDSPDWRAEFRLCAMDLNPDLAGYVSRGVDSGVHWLLQHKPLARIVAAMVRAKVDLAGAHGERNQKTAQELANQVIFELGFTDVAEPTRLLTHLRTVAVLTWRCAKMTVRLQYQTAMAREAKLSASNLAR